MERCPNCRARCRDEAECHRCGMELAGLLRIEAQAEAWERVAVGRLATGDAAGAAVAATRALALQHRPLALALYRFAREGGKPWADQPGLNLAAL